MNASSASGLCASVMTPGLRGGSRVAAPSPAAGFAGAAAGDGDSGAFRSATAPAPPARAALPSPAAAPAVAATSGDPARGSAAFARAAFFPPAFDPGVVAFPAGLPAARFAADDFVADFLATEALSQDLGRLRLPAALRATTSPPRAPRAGDPSPADILRLPAAAPAAAGALP